MNEQEFQDALKTALRELAWMAEDNEYPDTLPVDLAEVREVRTFDEAGVLTHNKGLVLTLADSTELQVTVIQSR